MSIFAYLQQYGETRRKRNLRMKYHIYTPLRLGAKDDQVTQLQRSLPIWTAPEPLVADGIFGSKTEDAVKAYQSAMELPVDGVVGRVTASALGVWADVEKGFDASHWQKISWGDFEREDLDFAIFKATQGTSFVDPDFSRNVSEAVNVGLDVGAYHFADLDFTPFEEAANFCRAVDERPITSAFLDLESVSLKPNFDYREWVGLWLDIVRAALPNCVEVGVYTSSRYLREISEQDFGYLRNFKLWGVNWSRQPLIVPWESWDCWQYTSKGQITGIDGNVDLNLRVKRG